MPSIRNDETRRSIATRPSSPPLLLSNTTWVTPYASRSAKKTGATEELSLLSSLCDSDDGNEEDSKEEDCLDVEEEGVLLPLLELFNG
jgi:hypothetical protein